MLGITQIHPSSVVRPVTPCHLRIVHISNHPMQTCIAQSAILDGLLLVISLLANQKTFARFMRRYSIPTSSQLSLHVHDQRGKLVKNAIYLRHLLEIACVQFRILRTTKKIRLIISICCLKLAEAPKKKAWDVASTGIQSTRSNIMQPMTENRPFPKSA